MAEDKDYQAVSMINDDTDIGVSFKGTGEELKRDRGGSEKEGIELTAKHEGKLNDDADNERPEEKSLLEIIETEEYYKVEEKVTVKALMNSEENPLLLAMKVTEKLHGRASKKKSDKEDFIGLANRVEDFTLRFLDLLKDNNAWYFLHPETFTVTIDTAIKLDQKKFFDHPVIVDLVAERWYGIRFTSVRDLYGPLWLFLNIWCLFDVVLFPLSFLVAFLKGWIATRVRSRFLGFLEDMESSYFYEEYKDYFTIPYFIFVRDTLSYLALLGLHFAICLESSQVAFSGLEWAILLFLVGRILTEIKQIVDLVRSREKNMKLKALNNYFRDRWNICDLAILFIYFCAIFPVRIATWVQSVSVTNNQALKIAECLYGFNAMLLTFRVFGSILEVFERVGTIQIALFNIIRDAVVVVLHFVVITLAFSITITKVFVAETSMLEENDGKYSLCNKTGILCWLKITSQLGLSLLDLSDGLDFFKSTDSFSETLAHLLFAAYLVMAIILLINMLIALLSNTYQRVQDNSKKEWSFQKAITIQTYCNYHPIPVPFNIVSILAMGFPCLQKRKTNKAEKSEAFQDRHSLSDFGAGLRYIYKWKYGDLFPPSDQLDQVLDDIESTQSMVNQVLCRTFNKKQGFEKALLPTGPKAWEADDDILVEGFLLTWQSVQFPCGGARYRTSFSPRFPHFEVMIMKNLNPENAEALILGVVFEEYPTLGCKGCGGNVALDTHDDAIYEAGEGKKARGPATYRRGDIIRCTVMFGDEKERDGKVQVPVVFTVNGSKIIPLGEQTYIDYSRDRPLYPCVFLNGTSSVLAKMCARDDIDYEGLQLQEVKSELTEAKAELSEVKFELSEAKSELSEVKSELSEVKSINRSLEKKLDAVLARLGEKEVNK